VSSPDSLLEGDDSNYLYRATAARVYSRCRDFVPRRARRDADALPPHTREKNYRARTMYDRIVARTDYICYDIDL
jgi:hypothetical protein